MDNESKNRNYVLVIPANVAHDPDLNRGITALLFGEILAALSVYGEFTMSNSALAKEYQCSTREIINCLNSLENKGLIKRQNVYGAGTNKILGRKIILADKATSASHKAEYNSNIVLNDAKLSWQAKGLYMYLKQHINSNNYREIELINKSKNGRESLRTALKELEVAGYLVRKRNRVNGKLQGSEWILMDGKNPSDSQ